MRTLTFWCLFVVVLLKDREQCGRRAIFWQWADEFDPVDPELLAGAVAILSLLCREKVTQISSIG